ncbi:hypothetical protein [Bacillus fungorum]|nr:hypothetical protein [Bacillus fungorum]
MNQKIILDAYEKGPEAVVSLFFEVCSQFEKRISELEFQEKKLKK